MKPARILPLLVLAGTLAIAAFASAAAPVAAIDATRPIAVNAAAAPNLTALVSAARGADLIATLSGPGPFTVFAPDNDAFARLPPGAMDTLLKPVNKPSLATVVAYHVVPGAITTEELIKRIRAGGGSTTLTTLAGQALTVTNPEGAILLTDVNGNKSYVETRDLRQSNGIVHIVNGVLIPKLD